MTTGLILIGLALGAFLGGVPVWMYFDVVVREMRQANRNTCDALDARIEELVQVRDVMTNQVEALKARRQEEKTQTADMAMRFGTVLRSQTKLAEQLKLYEENKRKEAREAMDQITTLFCDRYADTPIDREKAAKVFGEWLRLELVCQLATAEADVAQEILKGVRPEPEEPV